MFFQNKLWQGNQSIHARKKLFCHVIVKNYLCKVLCKSLHKIESTWRREIKEQPHQLTFLYCGETIRSSHRRRSIKKLFLKILQYPLETPVLESLLKKFQAWRPQNKCFPANIARILRLPISRSIYEWPLFNCFNG